MENKKGAFQNQNASNATPNPQTPNSEAIPKHAHQHNTAPQHLRFLQYGLKIPNHQHPSLNQSLTHQQLNSPLHMHLHQHNQQLGYQTTHRHLQPSPNFNSINIHQNPSFPPQKYVHQHPKTNAQQNQPIYHTTQPPPPSVHAHNQMAQNTPQIWVPHQPPPIHYHQQQQQHPQKQEVQKANSPSTPTQSQTKTKEVVDRKKFNSSSSQLRSPSAKRPLEAPVTMQGWLHKQGSEGLMLWKKRWFVLSEYCLFYYKGLEEEKLLGSILLPSYKVSVCRPEDKVNKKYAFKCEHANMRTYILAADSLELMMQWVKVLNLACMLQTNTDIKQPSDASETAIPQTKSFNTDVPAQQQVLHKQNLRITPVHTHSSSSATELSNPSQQELSQYNQPLYANAPPKPRRLNDGFSSPSPDVLDRYPQYVEPRIVAKSPVSMYSQNLANPQVAQPEYFKHHRLKDNPHEYLFTPTNELHPPNTERRTPDTYGRSKLHPNKLRHPTDYEDVYAEQSMYKRPLSPVAYTHVVKKNNPPMNPAYRAYTPVNMLGPNEIVQYAPPQMRKSPSYITRPHSADFLEYEINHRQPNPSALVRQQPRPKSSLDINRNTNDSDNYFYSEESYAEKMRKSAQYLHKMPSKFQTNANEMVHHKVVPNRYPENEHTFPLMRSSTQPINFNNLTISNTPPDPQPVRSRSVLSEGSLSKELDMDFCSSNRNILERESISPGYSVRDIYNYNHNVKNRDYDQFTRSASARLAQATPQTERMQDRRLMTREGERKREESMKRLLEWKQRMLQSPLNRKTQGSRGHQEMCENYHMDQENGYMLHNHPKHSEPLADDRRSVNNLQPQYNSYSSDDEASGSISMKPRDLSQLNTRDTFPRAISAKRIWTPNSQSIEARSLTKLNRNQENEEIPIPQGYYVSQSSSQHDLGPEVPHPINSRNENWPINDKMNVSAGELLGRTHEELVLLLIQLRRQSSQTLQAIENCYNEIDTIQAQLHMMDQARRMENLQKLEQIKQHLLELEKQYEKGKPLVNLVDNMVKLGTLYRVPTDRTHPTPYIRDRLEFNQQIQERRLLAEEKREWNRLNPNHFHLQEKVQQLYQLDRLIHEESGTLQNLQQDKEDIERALGGLRHRLTKGFNDPAEIEQARKQQILLENELSRVHLMLAQNSKKLEETVAGNARLEQELLVLKQKLQTSRQQRCSQQFSNAGDSLTCAVGNSAMLESDLQRVQKKIGDLQKQRQELSIQVRQLTDRTNNSPQQKPSPSSSAQNNQCKKKITTLWRETDLDTMNIVDHGESWENISASTNTSTPLYINTDIKQLGDSDFYNRSMRSSDSTSDNTSINSNLPQEKQEIKTVRIVKRESERRQRDREKTTTGKWDAVMEEDDSSQSSSILFRPTPLSKNQSTPNLSSPTYEVDKKSELFDRRSLSPTQVQFSEGRAASSTDVSTDKSPELSPIFKSEAARQIITEMAIQETPKQTNRRAVPKEKRRHYTAPHNNLIMKSLHQLPTDSNAFNKMILNNRRARDDLDMERALRQRIDAPDVVRSTLSNKELKYNESTIDNILGTPNKISIPERYIPEQLPQLSAEEQEYRLRKVESIKKMLSDTAIISGSSANLQSEDKVSDSAPNSITNKATTKMIEEKKQREHLLHLNQILAKQVMEMSKIVAVKALAKLPLQIHQMNNNEEEDSSPLTPLPLYQKRDNFYS